MLQRCSSYLAALPSLQLLASELVSAEIRGPSQSYLAVRAVAVEAETEAEDYLVLQEPELNSVAAFAAGLLDACRVPTFCDQYT